MGDNETTPWTSIDLYYKGFHVKKSIPANKTAEAIIETIEEHILKGFEPSWNNDTNSKHDPIMKTTQGQGSTYGRCEKCGAEKVFNPKTQKTFCKDKCWLRG